MILISIFDPFKSPSPIQFGKTHLRSRKFNKYIMISNGSRCTSAFLSNFFVSCTCHRVSHALDSR